MIRNIHVPIGAVSTSVSAAIAAFYEVPFGKHHQPVLKIEINAFGQLG